MLCWLGRVIDLVQMPLYKVLLLQATSSGYFCTAEKGWWWYLWDRYWVGQRHRSFQTCLWAQMETTTKASTASEIIPACHPATGSHNLAGHPSHAAATHISSLFCITFALWVNPLHSGIGHG